MNMQKEIGDEITHDSIKEFLWKTLRSGQVVPGYGHGVLRKPDPRFLALQQFCETRPKLLEDPVIQLVKKVRAHSALRIGCGNRPSHRKTW